MNEVVQALIAAAVAAIPVIAGVAVRLLRAWSDAQVAKIQNDDLRVRVQLAKDAVFDGVDQAAQELRPKLEAAAADGELTDEEKTELREAAKAAGRNAFSAAWWVKLRDDLGLDDDAAFDNWLDTLVESGVVRLKRFQ